MKVERFDHAHAFLASARTLLLTNEAANNLILGVSASAAAGDYDSFLAWLIRDGRDIVTAASQTPPNNLLLARTDSMDAIDTLAAVVSDIPGVVGAVPEVDRFVEHHPGAVRMLRQGVYSLSEVRVPLEPGSRRAAEEHREILLTWMMAFMEEVAGEGPDPEAAARNLSRRLDKPEEVAGVWVHEVEDEVVCMSGYSGPTPNGIRIGPVYTPSEHRGQGYASRLVAAQSQWLLDHGRKFCFLYTDLENPTSNAIYQKIGYEMVCEAAEYHFNR